MWGEARERKRVRNGFCECSQGCLWALGWKWHLGHLRTGSNRIFSGCQCLLCKNHLLPSAWQQYVFICVSCMVTHMQCPKLSHLSLHSLEIGWRTWEDARSVRTKSAASPRKRNHQAGKAAFRPLNETPLQLRPALGSDPECELDSIVFIRSRSSFHVTCSRAFQNGINTHALICSFLNLILIL